MTRSLFAVFGVAFFFVLNAAAQGYTTPKPGSAERKTIMAVLRMPVEKAMKQKVVFVVRTLRVSKNGTWAYAGGDLQTPSGGRVTLKGTVYEGEEDMFDNNFSGLLRKTGGKWKVVTNALGCTDVCYADWWSRYKAPKAIFPYTE